MPRQGITQLQVLNGWKEIANYLGKGVRTVQRYEREFGLPVDIEAKQYDIPGLVAAILEAQARIRQARRNH